MSSVGLSTASAQPQWPRPGLQRLSLVQADHVTSALASDWLSTLKDGKVAPSCELSVP